MIGNRNNNSIPMAAKEARCLLHAGVLAFILDSIVLPHTRNGKRRAACSQMGFLTALWTQKQQGRRLSILCSLQVQEVISTWKHSGVFYITLYSLLNHSRTRVQEDPKEKQMKIVFHSLSKEKKIYILQLSKHCQMFCVNEFFFSIAENTKSHIAAAELADHYPCHQVISC